MKFVDLADAGRQLVPLLVDVVTDDTVVVAVPPGGVPVGTAVGEVLDRVVTTLVVARDDSGVRVEIPVDVAGRRVVVIDDGVETGTAARAVLAALREAGAEYVVLAVPVCPREAQADLGRRYDAVVAVVRPMVRRSLRWHYESFA